MTRTWEAATLVGTERDIKQNQTDTQTQNESQRDNDTDPGGNINWIIRFECFPK